MYYNNNTIIYYDGKMVKAVEAGTDLYSQTLHYGYGVFEGIRSYQTANGPRIFKPAEHYERLIRSCQLLNIPFSYTVDELTNITYDVLQQNNFTEAYIRPLVICPPNMSLHKPQSSTLVIAAWQWGSYLGEKLLRLKISPFCRPHPRSTFVEAKACGHYVNSTLACSEAKASGYDEALLLDHEGFLAEGPGANLFFEKDGKLLTPQRGNILAGITRITVMDICKELNIGVEEGKLTTDDLLKADSAFYCGTGAEISGIQSVDETVFPKNWNESLGKRIQESYMKLVREESFKNILSVA
ncbi:MAG: branched-chain amino acid transaminase [Chitinophagaceae bacterium]|jgi:branched-chain amino acid aminotransferase|nr:branched-chain amino acid transaminase [Chitinophagaceae bacterium]